MDGDGIPDLLFMVFQLVFVAVTLVVAKVVDRVMGLRFSEEEEYVGLDLAQQGESLNGYRDTDEEDPGKHSSRKT